MFSAKTSQKTVYLSFQCYFPCLGQNHWSFPAVYSNKTNHKPKPPTRGISMAVLLHNIIRITDHENFEITEMDNKHAATGIWPDWRWACISS